MQAYTVLWRTTLLYVYNSTVSYKVINGKYVVNCSATLNATKLHRSTINTTSAT